MDSLEKLKIVEERYRQVLALAREQLKLLESGALDDLPAVLLKKAQAVEEAGRLMAELKAETGERAKALIQRELPQLGELVLAVMEVEDRCQTLLGPAKPAPPPPRGRVANLYMKNTR